MEPAPGAVFAVVNNRDEFSLLYIIYCRASTCCTVVNHAPKFVTIQVSEGTL